MNREVYSRTEKTSDRWETPEYFIKLLEKQLEFKFTLDPCASDSNHKCDKYYTIKNDGLLKDWQGERVFVNPPFSHIADWCEKCYLEGQKENTTIVMILPPRTDTRYWHDYIIKSREIWFCKGRVNFLMDGRLPEKGGATFPLCVIIFESNPLHIFPLLNVFYHKPSDILSFTGGDEG